MSPVKESLLSAKEAKELIINGNSIKTVTILDNALELVHSYSCKSEYKLNKFALTGSSDFSNISSQGFALASA